MLEVLNPRLTIHSTQIKTVPYQNLAQNDHNGTKVNVRMSMLFGTQTV